MAQPLWQQLAEALRADLVASPPGSPLPTDEELARAHSVSKMTAAQAVQHLAAIGLVTRVKGHGTVTRDLRPITLHTSRHAAAAHGAKAGGPWSIAVTNAGMTPEVRLLTVVRVAEDDLPDFVAEVFTEEMVRRDRLMFADGQPAAITTAWIPWRVAAGTRLADRDMIPQGTYSALREAGYAVNRAVESIRSRHATDAERKALRLPKDASALAVERISFYGDGQAIELLETVADATRVTMQHSIDL
ncbi:GntR family transcriptional regulator [Kribbella antibiotica]|uniref:GntR family transcriptional regulator n=1 Tax=Kribbella antibiotica TaxID=190195 RepID=A0A4R4ZGR3_9ACTN|nr:GntR family transcriptional regulator [Kribbella antibiotica]TDD56844.1 GntR family transcriptional regulator [Kribbella antibiotica]